MQSQSHPVQDSNRYRSSSPPPRPHSSASVKIANTSHAIGTTSAAATTSTPSPSSQQLQQQHQQHATATTGSRPSSPVNVKSSQQLLQNRIEQLQAENAALRKNRLLGLSAPGGAGVGAGGPLSGRQHLAWSSPSLPELTRPQPVRPVSGQIKSG